MIGDAFLKILQSGLILSLDNYVGTYVKIWNKKMKEMACYQDLNIRYVELLFKSVVTLFRQECLYEKQIDDDLATFYLSCSNFSACKESQQSPIVLPKTSSS